MEPKEVVSTLEASDEYKKWRQTHKNAIRAHVFAPSNEGEEWQVGYFDKDSNTISTFLLSNAIEVISDKDYLKTDKPIEELVVDKIVELKSAVARAGLTFKAHYKGEQSMRTFTLIQVIDHKAVFNITLFTRSFRTVNIRIDAVTGEVISHNLAQLIDFGTQPKQNK